MYNKSKAAVVAGLVATSLTMAAAPVSADVNVYSYRQPFLMKPLFDKFTEKTGIAVNVVYAKKGVAERLKREGANSPADLVMTVDIGRLNDVKKAGVVQPVDSPVLKANIPASLRDSDNHWFGLTTRARVIVASKDRVAKGTIKTYEDLASSAAKGKVCTRSGNIKHIVKNFVLD